MSIDDFRSHVLDKIGSKGALNGPVIGLTDNEAKAFSLSRAILAQANNVGVMQDSKKRCCGLPLGIQQQNGFVLPAEMMQRDILKSGTGGNLVGTEHMSSRFRLPL